MRLDKHALLKGIIGSLVLVGMLLLGSRRLLYFDAALTPYLYATIFAGRLYQLPLQLVLLLFAIELFR